MKTLGFKHTPLLLVSLLALFACSDDEEIVTHDVEFCVRAAWQNGLSGKTPTRALSTTDIFSFGTGPIVIDPEDYPATVNVHCSDGTDFVLTKNSGLCSTHSDYWQYTPSVVYKEKVVEQNSLTFDAQAVMDDPDNENLSDVLEGTVSYADVQNHHLQLTLHHTQALLRFAFKLNPRYNNVRYVKITGIKLNGQDCAVADKVLNNTATASDDESQQYVTIAYTYINPAVLSTDAENTIDCTYNIYDRDEATEAHLTRGGIVARNKFTLNALKDASNETVSQLQAGYYYDLKVALNPDYLYVLSEHDNEHLTIVQ